MTSSPILDVQNLDRTFKSPSGDTITALRSVNLTVWDGEFVSLVGASGSGKSTLLRIIDGLIKPTAGSIKVDGAAVVGPGPDRAFVFQQDSLLPWRTVIENVAYGLQLSGVPKREALKKCQRFIEMTGLQGFENYYPHQISGGMRQRANVARALVVDPKLLLLDEPFAALDSQTREIMQSELLRIWSQQRKTVLFVTHQIDEAVFLSDRVVVLSARPGTVREIIPVDFPRPRDLSIKRTERFLRIVDHVWQLIEAEVRQGMGLTTGTTSGTSNATA
jgi:NitT/TauT family transport system ATP-binding protein